MSIPFREKSPVLQGWPEAGGGQRQASGLVLEASGVLQTAWARILKTLHFKRKGLGVWGWEGISPPCSQENPGSVGTQLAHLSCRGQSLCRFSTPQLTSGFTPSLPRPLAPLQDTVLCGPHTRLSLPFTISEAKTGPAMGLDCEGGCAFLSRTAEGPASPLLPSPQRPRLITPGIGGSDLPGVHTLPKKSG